MTFIFSLFFEILFVFVEMLRLAFAILHWMPTEVKLTALGYLVLVGLLRPAANAIYMLLASFTNVVFWVFRSIIPIATSTVDVGFHIGVSVVSQTIPALAEQFSAGAVWFAETIAFPVGASLYIYGAQFCQVGFDRVVTGATSTRAWCEHIAFPSIKNGSDQCLAVIASSARWWRNTTWPGLTEFTEHALQYLLKYDDQGGVEPPKPVVLKYQVERQTAGTTIAQTSPRALFEKRERVWYLDDNGNNVPARVIDVRPEMNDVLYTLDVEGKDRDKEAQTPQDRLSEFKLQSAKFQKGSSVSYYDKVPGECVAVTVLQVHTCPYGGEAFYDVQFEDGKERNTPESNLSNKP